MNRARQIIPARDPDAAKQARWLTTATLERIR